LTGRLITAKIAQRSGSAAVAFGTLARGAVVVPWAACLAAAGLAAAGILWFGYIAPLRNMLPVAPGPEDVHLSKSLA
jgi:hypothetical protein